MEAVRGQGSLRGLAALPDLIVRARNDGVAVSWQDLCALPTSFTGHEPFAPRFLIDFVVNYLRDRRHATVLNPWCEAGSLALVLAVLESLAVDRAAMISRHQSVVELAQLLGEARRHEWRVEDPQHLVLPKDDDFDVVVSMPPWGLQPTERTFDGPDGQFKVTDSATHLLVLDACLRLSLGGQALFVVPQGFFAQDRPGALGALPRLGLHLSAALMLPEWTSVIAIPTYLVIIARGVDDEAFVGQLQPEGDNGDLLTNLQSRTAGDTPQMGRLVRTSEFRSFRGLVLQEEVIRAIEPTGGSAVRLGDISEAFDLGRQTPDGDFPERANAFYLPTIGNSPAVVRFADLRNKPHNYIQVTLRAERALADYLAAYFSTPLGLRARQSVERGSYIPKISKASAGEALVVLPPLEVQRQAVDVQRAIGQLRLDLAARERQLWTRPSSAIEIATSLSSLSERTGLEQWADSLPFPLASILWQYVAVAEIDATRAKKHLLHFFEAATEFLTCVLLSAFYSDPTYFAERKADWFPDPTRLDNLERSTFGTWRVIGARLAKSARTLLSDGANRAQLLRLFRCERTELVEGISSKDLFALFERTLGYRNDWEGHGGIESAREAERRLKILRDELASFREILATAFEFTDLLQPMEAVFSGGTFRHRALRLSGTRPIFRQVTVETVQPMDATKTYLLERGQLNPIALLPFVRMLPSPQTENNACYFFSRIEHGGVRFVSYHFEHEAEVVMPDVGVSEVLRKLADG
jgi:hypothetical protein